MRRIFLVGLKPATSYDLGVGIGKQRTDRSGIVDLGPFEKGYSGTIRPRLQR
jgi:hypothetical protein